MPVLEQACPEVEAGSVDDRLQVVVCGHKLGQRALAVLRLHGEWLPENHGEALLRRSSGSGDGIQTRTAQSLAQVRGCFFGSVRYWEKSQHASGTELASPPVTEHV